MKDKRRSRRRQMRYSAWLVYEDNTKYGCALSDISDTGARIDVETSDAIPDRFTLLLSGNGAARRKCRVVWRLSTQIGVSFERRLPADERTGLVPQMDDAWPVSPPESEPVPEF